MPAWSHPVQGTPQHRGPICSVGERESSDALRSIVPRKARGSLVSLATAPDDHRIAYTAEVGARSNVTAPRLICGDVNATLSTHGAAGDRMTTGRTRVELWSQSPAQLWRVVEADGLPARRWLPWEVDEGPLDRYGFDRFFGALFFSRGIDYIRAEAGELGSITVADIERERREAERLETRKGCPPPPWELCEFGLLGAYERRSLPPRARRQWHVERALRLVSAL